ncbi:MAG: FAD-binding oxidoreductase [Gemmataceae bacterium]
MEQSTCIIDGLSVTLHTPTSVADLASLVQQAKSQDKAVYPCGGRTSLGFGRPPTKPGVGVSLTSLNQVVDFPARDMTITVQTGLTLSDLRQTLAVENLRLPIDAPQKGSATIGGMLATNTSGLRRYGHGTLRDYVIGISAVNDNGQEFKGGGRVVKNVAGYDMCKLLIGSLGTLGIITQVTFKVLPVPELTALVTLACREDDLEAVLSLVHESRTRPTCFEVVNGPTMQWLNENHGCELPGEAWLVVVGFESNADTVNWQVQQIMKEVNCRQCLEVRVVTTDSALWNALTELPGTSGLPFSVKGSVLPSRCASFCTQVAQALENPLIHAHAGNGIVSWHSPETDPDRAKTVLGQLRQVASEQGGNVVVWNCPTEWKSQLDIWGSTRSDAKLMQRIKAQIDPQNVFNPGRYLNGL